MHVILGGDSKSNLRKSGKRTAGELQSVCFDLWCYGSKEYLMKENGVGGRREDGLTDVGVDSTA